MKMFLSPVKWFSNPIKNIKMKRKKKMFSPESLWVLSTPTLAVSTFLNLPNNINHCANQIIRVARCSILNQTVWYLSFLLRKQIEKIPVIFN